MYLYLEKYASHITFLDKTSRKFGVKKQMCLKGGANNKSKCQQSKINGRRKEKTRSEKRGGTTQTRGAMAVAAVAVAGTQRAQREAGVAEGPRCPQPQRLPQAQRWQLVPHFPEPGCSNGLAKKINLP